MHMNAVEYIRRKIFKLEQAPFARIAGVSQPTVSRWEHSEFENSEPSRKAMDLIRTEAAARGLPWSDSWFFQTFPDEPVEASVEKESAQ
jgi:transcriptional regulator with XRE-family HTH domain